jgi:hypothetical protein
MRKTQTYQEPEKECTTEPREKNLAAMLGLVEPGEGWLEVQKELPKDLDALAKESGALVRGRRINSAMVLLRLVLVYAVADWSLRQVGAWGVIQGVAAVSDVALLYRFRRCQRFLGCLLVRILQQRNAWLRSIPGVHLRLTDITVVSRPGSVGTDWRTHLSLDLGRLCIDGVEITDGHAKENLARFPSRPGDIWVGDRAFAYAKKMGEVLATAACFIVRIGWFSLPLTTPDGTRLELMRWLKTLDRTTEHPVLLATPLGTFPLRLIACPLPADKAEIARERLRKLKRKKGKKVQANTLLAAGYVLLLTNLPAVTWDPTRILFVYRLRWQIELQFKRLKSLLHFDHLRAQDPQLAQTYLLAKLLAALLLDCLVQHAEAEQPQLFASRQRPVSIWRLQALLWEGIRELVIGPLSLRRILAALPRLGRYLCDTPRSRIQQLAWGRLFLSRLTTVF